MSDNAEFVKYRMFRNFMVNELGIGKEEIRAWTQAAIEKEIERLVGQLNIERLARDAVDRVLGGYSYNSKGAQVFNLHQAIGKAIAERLTVSVTQEPGRE